MIRKAAAALALLLMMVATGVVTSAQSASAAASAPPQSISAGTNDWWTCNYYYGNAETKRGDSDRNGKGNQVREAQCLLLYLYGYNIGPSGVDGDFGGNTERAVRAFQADSFARNCRIKLLIDGKVGSHTWAALRSGTGCE